MTRWASRSSSAASHSILNVLVGYVALIREALDIHHGCETLHSAPYGFNKTFDETAGCRNKGMSVMQALKKP
jgi:hypothetical protein